MSILNDHFDGLMLTIFTDEQLKNMQPVELNERKRMFIAGANVVMTFIDYTRDDKQLVENLLEMRNEIDNYVKDQKK